MPKKFTGSTSFIIPDNASAGMSSSFAGSPFSAGFYNISSGGSQGMYINYLDSIFMSRRIKNYVAKQFVDSPIFTEDVEYLAKNNDEKILYIHSVLDFSLVKLELLSPLYTISYVSLNPDHIVPVLDAYINALIELNNELNIDSTVLEIIPLDAALKPSSPFSPNRKFLVVISVSILFNVNFWIINSP